MMSDSLKYCPNFGRQKSPTMVYCFYTSHHSNCAIKQGTVICMGCLVLWYGLEAWWPPITKQASSPMNICHSKIPSIIAIQNEINVSNSGISVQVRYHGHCSSFIPANVDPGLQLWHQCHIVRLCLHQASLAL